MPTRRKRITEEAAGTGDTAEEAMGGITDESEAEEAPDEEWVSLRDGVVSLRAEAVAHSEVGDRLSWADVKDLLDQLLSLPD